MTRPVDRWEPWDEPTVILSSGPARVVTDEPDPDFRPARVGFAPALAPVDPQRWEGDDS